MNNAASQVSKWSRTYSSAKLNKMQNWQKRFVLAFLRCSTSNARRWIHAVPQFRIGARHSDNVTRTSIRCLVCYQHSWITGRKKTIRNLTSHQLPCYQPASLLMWDERPIWSAIFDNSQLNFRLFSLFNLRFKMNKAMLQEPSLIRILLNNHCNSRN